ncbi:Na+/H+ antiporter subunit E [Brevibacterium litoralis]|uniref:Na+/H+ antiporter subunit E n=1 Tax=Brevibacterium litoralis TaxID=3138935 RepID=UPI0032EEBF61
MINPFRLIGYCAWIGKEIVSGTGDIVRNLFRSGDYGHPMIVELPLRCETDLEATVFASSITITPGTLVVAMAAGDATGRRPALFVHSMFADTEQEALDGLMDMEDRLLRMFRGHAPDRLPAALGAGPGHDSTEGREDR